MSGRALLGASVLLLVTGTASAELHPNTQPYAIKSPAAATGRAGNAHLAVRALRSKSGSTVVEVTTGQLDDGTLPVGNITKLQLKTYDGTGETSGTRNYTGLSSGGYLQYTFTDLVRGQPFQTQAHIKGVDGKRTDVVTVTGTVKLRPDLEVQKLGVPEKARIGAPVNLSATIREVNGEVGARASCVLRVDGEIIDRARGIWVDSGDTVACLFTHQFQATGTRMVSVGLESVVPADDDTSNDVLALPIEIVGNSIPVASYSAKFASTAGSSSGWSLGFYREDGQQPNLTDSGADWAYAWSGIDKDESSLVEIHGSERIQFPLNLVVTETADGIAFPMLSRTGLDASEQWGDAIFGGASAVIKDAPSNASLWIDTYRNEDQAGTYLQYERTGARATYFAFGYIQYWYQYAGGSTSTDYHEYQPSDTQAGLFLSPTTTYAISFDVQPTSGAGSGLNVEVGVPLTPNAQQSDRPAGCTSESWSDWYGSHVHHRCDEEHKAQSGVSGSVLGPQ